VLVVNGAFYASIFAFALLRDYTATPMPRFIVIDENCKFEEPNRDGSVRAEVSFFVQAVKVRSAPVRTEDFVLATDFEVIAYLDDGAGVDVTSDRWTYISGQVEIPSSEPARAALNSPLPASCKGFRIFHRSTDALKY
jgi:hypothetical protein